MHKFKNTDLVILVGGKGSRLRNITKIAKPLIKIKNIHFLQHLLNFYSKYNFKKIYLITSYNSGKFFQKFHKKKINLIDTICLKEKKPLDTAGALNVLRNKISSSFILLNGDSFLDYDISKLKIKNKNTIILVKNKNYLSNKKLSNIDTNSTNRIIYKKKSNYMNAGIYFFKKNIFKYIPKNQKISLENNVIPRLINDKKIFGHKVKSFFIDIGTPKNLKLAKKLLPNIFLKKTALFDRDGTINYDFKYVHSMKKFKLKPGILKSLKFLTKKNFQIFIVTNQAGIARGYYTMSQFYKFHLQIKNFFLKKKIIINDVYFCPHHPLIGNKKYKKKCNCRKPRPGLFNKIEKEWLVNKKKCLMIGDKNIDFKFAKKNNLKFLFYSRDIFKNIKKLSNFK